MVTLDAIPNGSGLGAGLDFIKDRHKLKEGFVKATEWVKQAIALVKTSPDNPYTDDEAIAGAILLGIEERRGKKGLCGRCSHLNSAIVFSPESLR